MAFLKKVFWVIIFCVALYGAYLLYTNWWNNGAGFSRVKEYAQNVLSKKGEEIKGQVQNKTNEIVSSTKQSAIDYIKQKTSDAFSSVKRGIVNGVSNILGVKPDISIPQTGVFQGGAVSAPSGRGFSAPPPPATITANVGFPLVFSINKNASYSVDWGDGKKDAGFSTLNEVTLLKHAWGAEGDYVVKIGVDGSGSPTDYIFPVRIYK